MAPTITTNNSPICPRCDGVLEAAVSAIKGEDDPPMPGDVLLCIFCGTWLRFGETLDLCSLSADDKRQLDPMVQQLMEQTRNKLDELWRKEPQIKRETHR